MIIVDPVNVTENDKEGRPSLQADWRARVLETGTGGVTIALLMEKILTDTSKFVLV